jgi:hypothetical protein
LRYLGYLPKFDIENSKEKSRARVALAMFIDPTNDSQAQALEEKRFFENGKGGGAGKKRGLALKKGKVYTGPRGGRYTIKNGKKMYQ